MVDELLDDDQKRQFPVGEVFPMRYNPKAPGTAVIFPGKTGMGWFQLLMGAGMLTVVACKGRSAIARIRRLMSGELD